MDGKGQQHYGTYNDDEHKRSPHVARPVCSTLSSGGGVVILRASHVLRKEDATAPRWIHVVKPAAVTPVSNETPIRIRLLVPKMGSLATTARARSYIFGKQDFPLSGSGAHEGAPNSATQVSGARRLGGEVLWVLMGRFYQKRTGITRLALFCQCHRLWQLMCDVYTAIVASKLRIGFMWKVGLSN
jgi:hypothetical protein